MTRTDDLSAIARVLAVDRLCAETVTALRAAGVDPLVLKGPTVASWLYPDAPRGYDDCDLLVAPDDVERARAVLAGRGLTRFDPPPARDGVGGAPVSETWSRGWAQVDLHQGFWGLSAPAAEVWAALTEAAETATVGGAAVRVPAVPARLLLVVLHALHHGPGAPRPAEDLRRAVARVPDADWGAAVALADRLGARRAFGAILPAVDGGAALAARLGLRERAGLRSAAAGAGMPVSEGLERLVQARGAREQARVVVAEVAPSATFMRWRYPLARRGRRGLAAAYALRTGELTVTAVRLARARARAAARR